MTNDTTTAQGLNKLCLCKTLDRRFLLNHLEGFSEIQRLLLERPHLFSDTAIFISTADFEAMKKIIDAIESTVALPLFEQQVAASKNFGPKGVFMGYDFHLTQEGPKLIEINTNAGGAYLSLLLAKAQLACCEEAKSPVDIESLEDKFFKMFEEEWRRQNTAGELKVIVIMDESPTEQYLYPEFKIFSNLFTKRGVKTFILEPSQIHKKNDGLWYEDHKIDLIYNRSTDFYFSAPTYQGVNAAYLEGQVVITPNPFHHALYADKENLEKLTSKDFLKTLGVDPAVQEALLGGIPHTLKVTKDNLSELWAKRKKYFFKPTQGYGSKGSYRGDKLTHRVWEEIGKGSYVAQELTPPSVRLIENDGRQVELKQDVRVYTYDGEVLLLSSRLYMGQTTNFRTAGGGFAAVFII